MQHEEWAVEQEDKAGGSKRNESGGHTALAVWPNSNDEVRARRGECNRGVVVITLQGTPERGVEEGGSGPHGTKSAKEEERSGVRGKTRAECRQRLLCVEEETILLMIPKNDTVGSRGSNGTVVTGRLQLVCPALDS